MLAAGIAQCCMSASIKEPATRVRGRIRMTVTYKRDDCEVIGEDNGRSIFLREVTWLDLELDWGSAPCWQALQQLLQQEED